MVQRILKAVRNLVLTLLAMLVTGVLLLNLTGVQTFLARQAAGALAKKLKTKVAVSGVCIDFLNRVSLRGVIVEDRAGDTLLYAGDLQVRATDWFFLKKGVPVLHHIGLKNTYVYLTRSAKTEQWNYQFIIDAFEGGAKDTTAASSSFELDLKEVDLSNIRFFMNDAWTGSDVNIDLGDLHLNARNIDLKKRIAHLIALNIRAFHLSLREYDGGRRDTALALNRPHLIDSTPFNPENWRIRLDQFRLQQCGFSLDASNEEPIAGQFDDQHLNISDINMAVEQLRINGDTLRARLNDMSALERCGLAIRRFQADVTVSPNASILQNLLLETPNSRLTDYFAMHYERFPDFTDFIHKVVMDAAFEKSVVHYQDIAVFAPILRTYRSVMAVNGRFTGTVDRMRSKNIDLSDGYNRVKGNLSITGLPNVDTTVFTLQDGQVFTGATGLLKYAPMLASERAIDIRQLQYALYQGNFNGTLRHFVANGQLHTNLGSLQSDIDLQLADKGAAYTGTITTGGVALGAFIREPALGSLAFQATVKGVTTDPKMPFVSVDGVIPYIDYNGYRFSDIAVNGLLDGKNFVGRALVNDSNLAFAFYGSVQFQEQNLAINANANLIHSNLQAIRLTKEAITLAADFDVDFTGNTIDDFLGVAKVYNVNLRRSGHRLDVDSLYLTSRNRDGEQELAVESNILTASIRGQFQLSALPSSIQSYLSGYLPNYIDVPTSYAPNQALDFQLTTYSLDSLLAVLAPGVSGFNNVQVRGSLNTDQQRLLVDGSVPQGNLYGVTLRDVRLLGDGDFRKLNLKAEAANLDVGDGILSASIAANTSLGNDSLTFNILSKSSDAIGAASLNGNAFARGDSLYLFVLPSDFLLNGVRWEVPADNHIVIADNFLLIKNLRLLNQSQIVAFNTADETSKRSLRVDIDNLSLGQIGNLTGLYAYRPSGRLYGNIRVDSLFGNMLVSTDLISKDVMFNGDTVGNIIAAGSYEFRRKLLMLAGNTGIYRENASLRLEGMASFDTGRNQLLSGAIRFNDASLKWLTPLTFGMLSDLGGSMNGTIRFRGSPNKPEVSGKIDLQNIKSRIDIIGCRYRIPEASISIDDDAIRLGTITLNDAYGHEATLTGNIRHRYFRDFQFERVSLTAPEFEVLNLKSSESKLFYGNLTANVQSLTVAGTFDDIRLNVTAAPASKGHVYIPLQSGRDVGTYNYVTFTSHDSTARKAIPIASNAKFSMNIICKMNPLAEMTIVLDPTTGDAINAAGSGNITLNMAANEPFKMYGNYDIDEGDYTFTFKQLFFRRKFSISSGSRISFYGPIENTDLRVNANYTLRARMIDMLTARQKESIRGTNDERDAKTNQRVNVILNMTGAMNAPKFAYKIELPDQRQDAGIVSQTIMQINQDDRELFNQVAALLLFNNFIPQQGIGSINATGALVNNVSDILSSTASSQLTNLASKLLKDPTLSVDLKYKNYNLSDQAGGASRNEVSLGFSKTLFDDRLIVELGSAYDWGRPTASGSRNSNNLNLAGDFRVQYLLSSDGKIRLNAFRSSNYDVLVDRAIYRGGIGLSYRTSFNHINELFGKRKPLAIRASTASPDSQNRLKTK